MSIALCWEKNQHHFMSGPKQREGIDIVVDTGYGWPFRGCKVLLHRMAFC